jgi:hypothetical protein
MNRKDIVKKWEAVLNHEALPEIKDAYRREVTAVLLENQANGIADMQAINEDAPTTHAGTYPDVGGMAKYDPVLIQLVRRAMPQMIAYDVAGVQPLSQPTGLVFSMKSRYGTMNGAEARFNEANSAFSGTGSQTGSNPVSGAYTVGRGMSTSAAEALGSAGGGTFNEMSFSIEKMMVEATTRALKAEYSRELEQDLKRIHGLSADAELSAILSGEILAEMNREIIRTVYITAKPGCVAGTATAGTFDLDVDSNGRWSVEKFKGLLFQVEREANVVAQLTRRGRANFIICSADVASAMAMAGVLDYAPALSTNLNVDEASTTYAGVLNGKYKVFVDPYSANLNDDSQFFVMGYKGSNAWDAGLYYCPYIPLEKMNAVDPATFQPKIAFKTRYGLKANPFAAANGDLVADSNVYFRRVKVANLM